MALKNVKESLGNAKKLIEIGVGETIEGYVYKIVPSQDYEGQLNFVMKDKDSGEETLYLTAGNVRYMLQDGKIVVGRFTTIKLLALKSKTHKRAEFEVCQDDEDTIEVPPNNYKPPASSTEEERTRIKQRAEQLANSQRGN